MLEQLEYVLNVPGSTNWGAWTTSSVNQLSAAVNTGGSNNNAALYAFRFTDAFLFANNTGANTINNLYDFHKIYKVVLKLTCSVSPELQANFNLGTNPSVQNNLSAALIYDPDISFIDYDGVGLTIATPNNGDATSQLRNRRGQRMHKAFSNITRTLYPRQVDIVASTAANGASGNFPVFNSNLNGVLGKRVGWSTAKTPAMFTGQIIVGFSYKSADANSLNLQPLYNYTVDAYYYCAFKSPLYG